MNNVKKIGILLLALGLMITFSHAANTNEKSDATLRLSHGSLAAGIGFSWGSGTLTYKGKDYPVSVNGLALGKVGVSEGSATGKVYNLKRLADFDGNYNPVSQGGRGVTMGGGRSAVAIGNQNGVTAVLSTTTKGANATVGRGGSK